MAITRPCNDIVATLTVTRRRALSTDRHRIYVYIHIIICDSRRGWTTMLYDMGPSYQRPEGIYPVSFGVRGKCRKIRKYEIVDLLRHNNIIQCIILAGLQSAQTLRLNVIGLLFIINYYFIYLRISWRKIENPQYCRWQILIHRTFWWHMIVALTTRSCVQSVERIITKNPASPLNFCTKQIRFTGHDITESASVYRHPVCREYQTLRDGKHKLGIIIYMICSK